MSAPVGPEKRARAEAYALQAAEAERRGDRRLAAALYRAAFLLLEGDVAEAAGEVVHAERAPERDSHPDWLDALLSRGSVDERGPTNDGGSSG